MNIYKEYGASFATRPRRKPMQPRVVESESQAPLVPRGAEKTIADNDAQFRRYQRHKADDRQVLLDGAHGEAARALVTLLKSLTPDQAPQLLELLEKFSWFKACTDDERAIVLSMIDDAIVRMRIRNGRPPIDDSLPGQDPTVFEICRSKLERT